MKKLILILGLGVLIFAASSIAKAEISNEQFADTEADKYYAEARAEHQKYVEKLIEGYSQADENKKEILRKAAGLVKSIRGQESETLLLEPVLEYVSGNTEESDKQLIIMTLIKSYNSNYLWYELFQQLAYLRMEFSYPKAGTAKYASEYSEYEILKQFEMHYSAYKSLLPLSSRVKRIIELEELKDSGKLNDKTKEEIEELRTMFYVQAWQRYEIEYILDKDVLLFQESKLAQAVAGNWNKLKLTTRRIESY